jgi:hypothetical protein
VVCAPDLQYVLSLRRARGECIADRARNAAGRRWDENETTLLSKGEGFEVAGEDHVVLKFVRPRRPGCVTSFIMICQRVCDKCHNLPILTRAHVPRKGRRRLVETALAGASAATTPRRTTRRRGGPSSISHTRRSSRPRRRSAGCRCCRRRRRWRSR